MKMSERIKMLDQVSKHLTHINTYHAGILDPSITYLLDHVIVDMQHADQVMQTRTKKAHAAMPWAQPKVD